MGRALSIPPLISGGIMLSYRCTNACRHCLYRCSPGMPDEWMSLDMAGQIARALAREPRLHSLHLAGGEATIRMDLLLEVLRLLRAANLPVAYVETNGSWCKDRDHTRREMERLRDDGLPAILVSVSMFHNEFVPFSSTRNCVEVASEVFGPEGVILYLPHMYEMLASMPGDGRHTLEEFCRRAGIEETSELIPRLYQVIPSGRAAEALRDCFHSQPASKFRGHTCRSELMSTTHFHLDHQGNLFTGLCAGIVPATVEDLHPPISAETHPIFSCLCAEGPFGLLEMASRKCGFQPRPDGYVSKCDLCFAVRQALERTGEFSELRPEALYNK